MKKALAFILLLCTVVTYSQTTNFSFTNKPFTDPEMNAPGRGAQWWNNVKWNNVDAPQIPLGTTTAQVAYVRFEWDQMETGMNQYTFTGPFPSLEYHIKYYIDMGMLFAFGGVMSVCDGCGNTPYPDGSGVSLYPYYLHQMMQAEPVPDWKTGNIWIPNWNSPSYLARWKALNDTIARFIENGSYVAKTGPWVGKTVRYKDVLDFVDIRGYGNFGEWHNYPYWRSTPVGAKATTATLKQIIDVTVNAFPNNQLVIIGNAFDAGNASEISSEVGVYALTKRNTYGNIGWRRDNIGGVGDDNYLAKNSNVYNGFRLDTAITNRWKTAMITGEPLNGGGTCCPLYYDIRREIGLYHYAGFGNGNYGGNTQAVWDTMTNAFKLTGFRYNLNGGSMNTVLAPGQNFNVTLNWRNVGAAPSYQKRWRVKYLLRNSSNAVVASWNSKFNTYLYLPDIKDSTISENFLLPANIPVGSNYKLDLLIQDTTGVCSGLQLALNSPLRNSDGSYTLRSNIAVSTALPVKWHSVSITNKTTNNLLEWNVSCEDNTGRFEIERSQNGMDFKTIGTVTSIDSNCLQITYRYTDYDITGGVSYYRIKQYDLDGNFYYSKIVSTINSFNNNVMLYPNPAQGVVNIVINNTENGELSIRLFSMDGKLLKQISQQKQTNIVNTILDLRSLTAGNYFVRMYMNGQALAIKKVVKN